MQAIDGLALAHQLFGQDCQRQQAGQDNDKRYRHFESRTDDRRHLRASQIPGGEHALHYEEIGSPIAERDDEPKPQHDADPVDAHRVCGKGMKPLPEMRVVLTGPALGYAPDHAVPAAGFN